MVNRALLKDTNRIVAQLLLTGVDLALTFMNIAKATADPNITRRSVGNARRAYDDIGRRRGSVSMSPQEIAALQGKLDSLRASLRYFGENV